MTHGHLHGVKNGLSRLLTDAHEHNAQAVLFGHTHEALCYREPDGLWVLNPGSCRSEDGSVGVIRIEDGKISACSILKQADLEQWPGGASCHSG
jgi:predicted phosphodiesterase